MKTDRTSQLIDYLDGLLPEHERRDLERELTASSELRAELADLRHLLAGMDQAPDEQPSPALQARFREFLEQQQTAAPRPGRIFRLRPLEWGAAAAVALLVIGLGFGALWQRNLRQQRQIDLLVEEIQMTRKMMVLSMLEQPSASQRIQAVNTARDETRHPDPQIVRALIAALDTDDNVNVRVKAAEALLEFAGYPGVVDALAASLNRQESPDVQITLIEVLTAIKARGAADEFREILRRDDLLDVVRNKAAAGLEQLM